METSWRPQPVDKCGDCSDIEVWRQPAHKRDEREETKTYDVQNIMNK